MQPQNTTRYSPAWLLICLLLIVAGMIMDGALYLRESDYSIGDWKPVSSMVFTATDDDFAKEFEFYKNMPQFQKLFTHMEISGFKTIYVLEYIRYVLRYLIILAAFLPLLFFTLQRSISIGASIRLLIVFAFGQLPSIAHSFMADNALADDPRFVPYRLSLLLALRFIFLGLVIWQLLTFSYPKPGIGGLELPRPGRLLKSFSCITLLGLFMQIVLGGTVSGLHAGLIFNTFPLMDGSWTPDGLWPFPEWYKNLFEDATTAQYLHRMIAYFMTGIILLFWLLGHNNPHIAHLLPILFSIFIVQFLLGVLTLLFTVPVPISTLHHANAILLFGIAVTIMHRLFIPVKAIYYDIGSI